MQCFISSCLDSGPFICHDTAPPHCNPGRPELPGEITGIGVFYQAGQQFITDTNQVNFHVFITLPL
jgi:hypothetical protein